MKQIRLAFLLLFSIPSFAQVPQWQWAANFDLHFNSGRQLCTTDAAGNSYLAGDFSTPSMLAGTVELVNADAGTADLYVIKFSPQGEVLWAKRFGGANQDSMTAIASDPDGNILITGTYTFSIAFGDDLLSSEGQSSYLAKLDSNGAPVWAKTHNTDNALVWDAQDIAADSAGNVLIAGVFAGQQVSFDDKTLVFDNALDTSGHAFVGKFNADGNCIWLRGAQSGSAHFIGSDVKSVAADGLGNVYIAGKFGNPTIEFGEISLTKTIDEPWNTNLFIAKYDADGNVQWAQRAGTSTPNPTQATALAIDKNNQVFLTGTFNNTIAVAGSELDAGASGSTFIAKYDGLGNGLWARQVFASNCGSFHDSLGTDNDGNAYLSGFSNCQALNFGNGVSLTLAGQGNFYVAKYSPAGDAIWVRQSGTASIGSNSAISVVSENEIYVAGAFPTPVLTFGPVTLTRSASAYNTFLAKLYLPPLASPEFDSASFAVFPIPVKSHFGIAHEIYPQTYSVSDMSGRIVLSGETGSEIDLINAGGLPSGTYILRIGTGKTVQTQKFVKE